MKPRQRRIIIPGLLLGLLVIVLLAALTGRAQADESGSTQAFTINDSRITESSGLVMGYDGLLYSINDSGNDNIVYVIDPGSGAVLGATTVTTEAADTEALAVADGTLWIADTGTNTQMFPRQQLLAIDVPSPGQRTVSAQAYPLEIPSDPDIEAMLISPKGDIYLVTKSLAGGVAYQVSLDSGTVREVANDLPVLVTDGAFSPDGSTIALLTYTAVVTLDPDTWEFTGGEFLPAPLTQAETLAFTDEDTLLVGTEGENSPVYTMALPAGDSQASEHDYTDGTGGSHPYSGFGEVPARRMALVAAVAGCGVVVIGVTMLRARRPR